jgi:histidine triad (HIT) family protein
MFRLSKTPFLTPFVGIIFEYASFLFPRLPQLAVTMNTETIIAFHHPQPVYPNHLVIIPKKAISTFLLLLHDKHIHYLFEILGAAWHIIHHSGDVYETHWLLRVNGGKYQDVKQVHFHLSTDDHDTQKMFENSEKHREDAHRCDVLYSSYPGRHEFLIVPTEHLVLESHDNAQHLHIVKDMIACFQGLDQKYHLTQVGYTVIFKEIILDQKRRRLSLHIGADKT